MLPNISYRKIEFIENIFFVKFGEKMDFLTIFFPIFVQKISKGAYKMQNQILRRFGFICHFDISNGLVRMIDFLIWLIFLKIDFFWLYCVLM